MGCGSRELFGAETVPRWDPMESGRQLGPLRSGFIAVRIVTGDTPRIHQLEQVTPRFLDGSIPSLRSSSMSRIFIGVDVSKDWLDAAVRNAPQEPRRFANGPDGIDQLVAWAQH